MIGVHFQNEFLIDLCGLPVTLLSVYAYTAPMIMLFLEWSVRPATLLLKDCFAPEPNQHDGERAFAQFAEYLTLLQVHVYLSPLWTIEAFPHHEQCMMSPPAH